MRPIDVAATDCGVRGASCLIATATGHTYQVLPGAGMTAHPSWPTMVHVEDPECELPYRVDLATPLEIVRRRPAEPLLDEADAEVCFKYWDTLTAQRVSKAAAYLLRQTAPRGASRYGVVVPDELTLEAAETFLRSSGLPRSRMVLLPWPIAAAWAWLELNSSSLQADLSIPEGGHCPITCIQVGRNSISSVVVHLVNVPDGERPCYVPARNRDRDHLAICSHAGERQADPLPSIAAAAKGCIGIIICGRSWAPDVLASVDRAIREVADRMSVRLVSEADFPEGLLARGALAATSRVAAGAVPYYETMPKIELLISTKILEDRPNPLHLVSQPAWLDCLRGVRDAHRIADGTMIPANRSIRHRPDYKSLELKTGERNFLVSLDRRDVRVIRVAVEGEGLDRERGISLQVEYRLGSGRPKITVERPRFPDKPLVFEWGSAEEFLKSRDEVCRYSTDDLLELYEERQRRREMNGLRRYEE